MKQAGKYPEWPTLCLEGSMSAKRLWVLKKSVSFLVFWADACVGGYSPFPLPKQWQVSVVLLSG